MASVYAAIARGKSRALKYSLPSLRQTAHGGEHGAVQNESGHGVQSRQLCMIFGLCNANSPERVRTTGGAAHFFFRVAKSVMLCSTGFSSAGSCLLTWHSDLLTVKMLRKYCNNDMICVNSPLRHVKIIMMIKAFEQDKQTIEPLLMTKSSRIITPEDL